MHLRCFFFSKNSRNLRTFIVKNFSARKFGHVNLLTNLKSEDPIHKWRLHICCSQWEISRGAVHWMQSFHVEAAWTYLSWGEECKSWNYQEVYIFTPPPLIPQHNAMKPNLYFAVLFLSNTSFKVKVLQKQYYFDGISPNLSKQNCNPGILFGKLFFGKAAQ